MKRIVIRAARPALLVASLAVATGCGSPPTNARPGEGPVVCFGDSLTAGTGAPQGRGYPSVLSDLLGEPVVNAGVPGDTTSSALARLERDVLAHDPRVVFITLGGNDMMRDLAPEATERNLVEIVSRLHATGALVVLGGIELPIFGSGLADAYDTVRDRTGCLLVDNVFAGIMGRPGMMSDRIHPSARGYERLARTMYDAASPHLD